MNTSPAAQPTTDAPKAAFEAVVVGRKYVDITLTKLIAAVKAIEPDAVVGDWTGPFTEPPSDALGIQVLSVNGIKMSVFSFDAGLPPNVFDCGPITNPLMPDAPARLRNNRAHAIVMPVIEHTTLAEAVATAREVTLVARAIGTLMQADAVHWIDGHNVVPIEPFNHFTQSIRDPKRLPVEAWVRFMCGTVTDPTTRRQGLVAGTYGLWAFGLPEIDHMPSALPFELLLGHAYSLSNYMLATGATISIGDVLEAGDGRVQFKVESIGQSRTQRLQCVATGTNLKRRTGNIEGACRGLCRRNLVLRRPRVPQRAQGYGQTSGRADDLLRFRE